MRRVALPSLLLLAACGSVSGPDGAPTPLNPAVVLDWPGRFLEARLAVAPSGRAVAVWTDRERIYASETDDGVRWMGTGPIDGIGPLHGIFDLVVELDANGDGFAAWTQSRTAQDSSIVACRYRARSGWDAPREVARVAPRGVRHTALSVASTGEALLAWGGEDIGVLASSWDGAVWSPPERLAAPRRLLVLEDLQLRLRGRTAAVLWCQSHYAFPEENRGFAAARVREAASGWSEEVELGHSKNLPALCGRPAVDARGAATFLWGTLAGYEPPFRVWATRYDPQRGWHAPEWLGEYDASSGIEADEGGVLTAILEREDDGTLTAHRAFVPFGWHAVGAVAGRAGQARNPMAGLAPGSSRAAFIADGSPWLARIGAPWTPERVPASPDVEICPGASAHHPRLGVHADGSTTLLWLQQDCGGNDVLVAWRAPAPR
jgi:hypothetical protein